MFYRVFVYDPRCRTSDLGFFPTLSKTIDFLNRYGKTDASYEHTGSNCIKFNGTVFSFEFFWSLDALDSKVQWLERERDSVIVVYERKYKLIEQYIKNENLKQTVRGDPKGLVFGLNEDCWTEAAIIELCFTLFASYTAVKEEQLLPPLEKLFGKRPLDYFEGDSVLNKVRSVFCSFVMGNPKNEPKSRDVVLYWSVED